MTFHTPRQAAVGGGPSAGAPDVAGEEFGTAVTTTGVVEDGDTEVDGVVVTATVDVLVVELEVVGATDDAIGGVVGALVDEGGMEVAGDVVPPLQLGWTLTSLMFPGRLPSNALNDPPHLND